MVGATMDHHCVAIFFSQTASPIINLKCRYSKLAYMIIESTKYCYPHVKFAMTPYFEFLLYVVLSEPTSFCFSLDYP